MKKYNYVDEVTKAVTNYINENGMIDEIKSWYDGDSYDVIDKVVCRLHNEDDVTGGGSNSYFCSDFYAEEALCFNWDLITQVVDNANINVAKMSAEEMDVAIRQYLLWDCVKAVLIELEII